MQITDVRVRKVTKEGKLKAVVSITIDDEFVVHDIKVIEGEKGLFIAMPSKKALDGEYRDIAHPINSGTRERIQSTILSKYEESLKEARTVKSGKSEYGKEMGLSQCGSPLCRIYRVLRVRICKLCFRYIRQFECHIFSGCRMFKIKPVCAQFQRGVFADKAA